MTHARAVALMFLATLLWSIAGIVTRHLDAAQSFEVTFWRSLANALALLLALSWLRGAAFWADLRHGGRVLWASGLCWATMYTAFMVAMMLTTVANVLVAMSVGPLIAALFVASWTIFREERDAARRDARGSLVFDEAAADRPTTIIRP